MGKWQIIKPGPSKQLIHDPLFDEGIGDWTNDSAWTDTQNTDEHLYGKYSLKSISSSSATQKTGHLLLNTNPVAGTTYYASAFVMIPSAAGSWSFGEIQINDFAWSDSVGTVEKTANPNRDGFDKWLEIRCKIEIVTDVTGGGLEIGFELPDGVASKILYLDAIQFQTEWYGTVVNGDQPRLRVSKYGGYIYDLDDDLDFQLENMQGVGAPPVSILHTQRAGIAGSQVQGQKIQPRSFALISSVVGSSLDNFHEKRNAILDVITPEAGNDDQPLTIRYNGSDVSKEIRARYMDGLGLTGKRGFYEKIALHFAAYDWPFFESIGSNISTLETEDTTAMKLVLRRREKKWDDWSVGAVSGSYQEISGMHRDKYGRIFVAGIFEDLDGVGSLDYVARWNGGDNTWNGYGFAPTTASNWLEGVITDPKDDYVYVYGIFDGANSDANQVLIAAFNGATWESVGVGHTQVGSELIKDAIIEQATGDLWVVGGFIDFDGVADVDLVGVWDGSTWDKPKVGGGGASSNWMNTIFQASDGKIWVGGVFDTLGGVATFHSVAYWDGSDWVNPGGFADGVGGLGSINSITEGPNGDIYVAGNFEELDDDSTPMENVARWNGTRWQQVGEVPTTGEVKSITWQNGTMIAAGTFKFGAPSGRVGGATADYLVFWNGTSWHRMDLSGVTSAGINLCHSFGTRNLYLGFPAIATVSHSGFITATNAGNAKAYPIITVERSGGNSARLQFISNNTTGIQLDIEYDLIDGEILTLDFTPGQRSMRSNVYGEFWKLLPGSDFTSFALEPGDNEILCFVDDDGATVTAEIKWHDSYLGVD